MEWSQLILISRKAAYKAIKIGHFLDGVREPNPFKRKREMDESVFTDEDFMRVGPDRAKVCFVYNAEGLTLQRL